MDQEQFWHEEEHSRKQGFGSWIAALSGRRQFVFAMILLFVVAWSFFLGHRVSSALAANKLEEAKIYSINGRSTDIADNYVPVELEGLRTLLIVGCDTREEGEVSRSDTIMVAFFNINEKKVDLLSIPRDSYARIPGFGSTKINHAYAYGGITLTQETVEYLLGITIDDYLIIDFQGFKDVIDAVGGVEIDVDMDMYNYNEQINIKQGQQVLNGHDALGYVRYRGEDCSDYQRIQHQQNMVSAAAKKLLSFSTLPKIANIISIGLKNITTSIDTLTAMDLASYALKMDFKNMNVYTVQGSPKYILTSGVWVSYEIINKTELMTVLNQIAGDGFSFAPNVIDDGGQGLYSPPADNVDDGEGLLETVENEGDPHLPDNEEPTIPEDEGDNWQETETDEDSQDPWDLPEP